MVGLAGGAAAGADAAVVRRRIQVDGTVQGVGFRPHVYLLATRYGLAGWVLNSEQGVTIEIEGSPAAVTGFETDLRTSPPPLAVIARFESAAVEPQGEDSFQIVASVRGDERRTSVPADAATCPDCRRDILDGINRRFRYPFTNCTNCGPRFTIVRDLPYDRPMTTMAGFPMCPDCAREYHDPLDRRFHAQPNACPVCGPQAEVLDRNGKVVSGDWLALTLRALRQGQVVAVKGLGGFHLACDAACEAAVARLRERKRRPDRPLAVMARSIATVRQICLVSEAEERLLMGPAAPIVLLERIAVALAPGEAGASGGGAAADRVTVAPSVAPGLPHLGVMLPYTPLHHLLLAEGPELLVMTSGNPSGLPLAIDNDEAVERLGQIADLFLVHNRPIHTPCDDSVMQWVGGQELFHRRSRGFVPRPVAVAPADGAPAVLGMGGDLKNALCLLEGGRAVFSQHLGDLESEEAQANWRRALTHVSALTGIRHQLIAHDMHPGYFSVKLARSLAGLYGAALVPVQHHHAHLAACLAEHRLAGPAIGLVLDGTGWGPDGAIWGFEILAGDLVEAKRIAHLAYSPLPGGDAGVRLPLMAATGLVAAHLGAEGLERLARLLQRQGGPEPAFRNARALIASALNCPPAGTAGRLFDGVAAILGICRRQTYEGQAAIELGAWAATSGNASSGAGGGYPVDLQAGLLSPAPLLDGVLADCEAGRSAGFVAARFLESVAQMLRSGARLAREQTGLTAVCLSGGTFQSAWLSGRVAQLLTADAFTVYRHRQVPPGDGGLALGQAMVARARWQAGLLQAP